MTTQLVVHLLLVCLGVLLIIKALSILKNLKKEKLSMYFLTRKQVKNTVLSLSIFGIVYIVLQIIDYVNGVWLTASSFADWGQFINEGFLIVALLYLIFKFKKK